MIKVGEEYAFRTVSARNNFAMGIYGCGSHTNERIANRIGNRAFKVAELDHNGYIKEIEIGGERVSRNWGTPHAEDGWTYWFNKDEVERYLRLVSKPKEDDIPPNCISIEELEGLFTSLAAEYKVMLVPYDQTSATVGNVQDINVLMSIMRECKRQQDEKRKKKSRRDEINAQIEKLKKELDSLQ